MRIPLTGASPGASCGHVALGQGGPHVFVSMPPEHLDPSPDTVRADPCTCRGRCIESSVERGRAVPVISMFYGMLADWELAVNGQQVFRIEPLR